MERSSTTSHQDTTSTQPIANTSAELPSAIHNGSAGHLREIYHHEQVHEKRRSQSQTQLRPSQPREPSSISRFLETSTAHFSPALASDPHRIHHRPSRCCDLVSFHPLALRFVSHHLRAYMHSTDPVPPSQSADMGVFASNQTGNTVLLMFAIVGGPGGERIPLVQTAVSLCVFLFAGLLSGQLAHLWPGGPRSRSFLFLAGLVQSLPLFVPAALLQTGGWTLLDDRTRHGGSDAWKVLVFLAGTSGIQVSCARLSGCQEIPTAMLTSPWIDLLADRQLFAPKLRGKEVMPRNLRAAYIAVFVLGSLVGGFMNRYSSSANVIYLTAAIKVATALSFLADRVGDTTRLPT